MKISINTKFTLDEQPVLVPLYKVYEAFYKELPKDKRYFLGVLPCIAQVNLYKKENNDDIFEKCTLFNKDGESVNVIPENIELYSKIFKSLYDEKKNK